MCAQCSSVSHVAEARRMKRGDSDDDDDGGGHFLEPKVTRVGGVVCVTRSYDPNPLCPKVVVKQESFDGGNGFGAFDNGFGDYPWSAEEEEERPPRKRRRKQGRAGFNATSLFHVLLRGSLKVIAKGSILNPVVYRNCQ